MTSKSIITTALALAALIMVSFLAPATYGHCASTNHNTKKHPGQYPDGCGDPPPSGGSEIFEIDLHGALVGNGTLIDNDFSPGDTVVDGGVSTILSDVSAGDMGVLFVCTSRNDEDWGSLDAIMMNEDDPPQVIAVINSGWFVVDNNTYSALILRYDTISDGGATAVGTLDVRTSDVIGLAELTPGVATEFDINFIQANGGARGNNSCRENRTLSAGTTLTITRLP